MKKKRQHHENTEKILVINNDFYNLDVLGKYLQAEGFDFIIVERWDLSLKRIKNISDVSLIILDCVAFNIQDLEFIKNLKKDENFKCLPIILQTGEVSDTQILEEIQTGILYYLTKPYEKSLLLSIIRSALKQTLQVKEMMAEVKKYKEFPCQVDKSEFRFSTVIEARNLACLIANSFPDPDSAVYGLTELMLNAIEHGNLGITYSEKKQLMLSGNLYDEIQRRSGLNENKNKYVCLSYEETEEYIQVRIKDQGNGFNWQKYLQLSPERACDPNGRGIATAKLSFTSMEYLGNGNEVVCRIKKSP